jgi:hypothetical protein
MDQQIVRKLEDELEDAIAEVLLRMGRKKLPLMPTHSTLHLMAKAAVAVYESGVEYRGDSE